MVLWCFSTLSLSLLARRRWIDLHDAVEAQLGEFGELANVRPSGSKAADNLLRVAGILAVVEESSVVEVEDVILGRGFDSLELSIGEAESLSGHEIFLRH